MKKIVSIKKLISTALAVTLAISSPVFSFAADDVSNPAIEGFYIVDNGNGGGFSWTLDEDGGFNGTCGLNMQNKQTSGAYGMFTQTIKVETGKSYAYGFKSKAIKANGATVRVDYGAKQTIHTFGNTWDWENFERTYNHTGTAENIKLRFMLEGDIQNIWFDDFYCYELNENGEKIGANLSPNPDLDTEKISLGTDNLSEKFSMTEYYDLSAAMPYYPVTNAQQPKLIDGDLSDWSDENKMHFPLREDDYKILINSIKPENTVDAMYSYDDKYFYFAAQVNDTVHYSVAEAANYWKGDSLQVTLGKKDDTYGTEIGMCLPENSSEMLFTFRTAAYKTDVVAKGKRNGNITTYEVAIPWTPYFDECPDEYKFSFAINDNDGNGRASAVEYAPGIISGKTSADFTVFKNLTNENKFIAFADGLKTINGGVDNVYNISVLNFGDTEKFTVSGDWFETYEAEIDKNAGFKKSVVYNTTQIGDKTLNVKVENDNTVIDIPLSIVIRPTKDMVNEYVKEFNKRIDKIESLIKQCKEKNINTDYVEKDFFIAKRFIDYIQEDMKNNYFETINYTLECMEEIITDATNLAEAYLDGSKTAPEVEWYSGGQIEVDGKKLVETVINEDGTLEKKPVFLLGYGHFQDARGDWSNFKSLGMNSANTAIGMADVIKQPGMPCAWKFIINSSSGLNVSPETKNPIEGNTSLKLQATGGGSTFEQFVMLEPNTTYEYGFTISADKMNAVGMTLGERDGALIYTWNSGAGKGTYHSEYTTAAGYKRHAVMLSIGATTGSTVDNIYVRKKGTTENLLINSDFEYFAEQVEGMEDYAIDYVIIEDMASELELARKHKLSLNASLDMHSYPTYLSVKYPEIAAKYSPYSPLNIAHPKVRELAKLFIEKVMPVYNNYADIINTNSILNEPEFDTTVNPEYFNPLYREYLKDLFDNSIEKLNEEYETSYTSFEEIEMPKKYSATPMFYDFKQFNDGVMIDYQKFLAENIKRVAPDVKIHFKTMMSNAYNESDSFMRMGDVVLEDTSSISDIFGCDAYACFTRANQPVQGKNMVYRYMTSIGNKPVVNSEDHIIPDKFMNYDRKIADFQRTDMWNGALYGRGQGIIWIYARTYNKSSYRYCALSTRPDALSKMGKIGIDLNRLSREVAAFVDRPSDVGVLFSESSRTFNLGSMNTAYNIFNALNNIGKKSEFISEDQIEKINDYKLLFIPASTHVSEKTVQEILSYVKNGGKIVIFGENSLKYTPNGSLNNVQTISDIYANSLFYETKMNDTGLIVVSPSENEFNDAIRKICLDAGMTDIEVVDALTGERIDSVSIETASLDGRILVNITRYDWENSKVKLIVHGNSVEKSTDLLAIENLDEEFELKGYEPRLLEIELK